MASEDPGSLPLAIEIRRLHPGEDATAFRTLNEEWITRHFRLEAKDIETLSDPENSIIGKGGHIFLAFAGGKPVGCVALMPMENGVYELSKMAVSPHLRGQGIGRRLLECAIARRARAKLASGKGPQSSILDLAKGNIDAVTSEMVGHAYAAGDELAKQTLQETVQLLSLWLSNIVDLLEPDVIIIGGGVAAMLNPFFGDISAWLSKYCINSRCQEIPLLKAHYGADAGIAGGAALWSESARSR